MLLAIDVGNTNITVGVFKGKEIVNTFRLTTKQSRTSDEYAIHLSGMLLQNGIRFQDIKDVIISSVVPVSYTHLKWNVCSPPKFLPGNSIVTSR